VYVWLGGGAYVVHIMSPCHKAWNWQTPGVAVFNLRQLAQRRLRTLTAVYIDQFDSLQKKICGGATSFQKSSTGSPVKIC